MKAHYAIYDSFGEIVKIYSGSQISIQCQDNEKYVLLNNTYLQLSNLQENYWYDNSSSAFKQKTEVDLNMPSEVNQNATVSFTVPSGSYAIVTGVTDKLTGTVNLDTSSIKYVDIYLFGQHKYTNRVAIVSYVEKRKKEYPSVIDQLDELYHNGIDGWKAKIKEVKDKYPKS